MNDTHMSHAMEFAYPQSMANCVTCHEGKLDAVLTDANFTLATCKSCHPVTGTGGTDAKRAPALKDLMRRSTAVHTIDLYAAAARLQLLPQGRRAAASPDVQRRSTPATTR